MRALTLAGALSAMLHAALVGWFASRPPRAHATTDPAAPTVDITLIQPAPPPPAPMDVALVEPPAAPIAAAPPATAAVRVEASAARIATTATEPRPPDHAPDELPGAPTHSPLMTMRQPPRPDLRLADPRGQDPDETLGAPAQPRPSGQLHDSGSGTHTSDQGVFVAKVDADGAAHITDKPSVQPHIILPSPRSLGLALSHWYTDSDDKFQQAADTSMAKQIQVTPGATTDPVDPVASKPADRVPTVIIPVIGGPLDVNDWLLRRHGDDPYASRKLALLDATRDERAQIGSKHRDDQLRHVDQIMQKNLAALWEATRDPRTRKEALFELWDECAETGDPALVEAGQAARRMVIGFIRSHLPAGSPAAFTPAEIAELSRHKHATAAFQPYEP